MSIFRDVLNFHRRMRVTDARPLAPMHGQLQPEQALDMAQCLRDFREKLLDPENEGNEAASRFAWIFEEVAEMMEAHARRDLVGEIDARLDLIYFTAGDLDFFGIDPYTAEDLWSEVHAANMAKLPQELGASRDAKIRKPVGWLPPRLKEILEAELARRMR
jgi:predicted HAD superfamily Cof-like phosphohydrolase